MINQPPSQSYNTLEPSHLEQAELHIENRIDSNGNDSSFNNEGPLSMIGNIIDRALSVVPESVRHLIDHAVGGHLFDSDTDSKQTDSTRPASWSSLAERSSELVSEMPSPTYEDDHEDYDEPVSPEPHPHTIAPPPTPRHEFYPAPVQSARFHELPSVQRVLYTIREEQVETPASEPQSQGLHLLPAVLREDFQAPLDPYQATEEEIEANPERYLDYPNTPGPDNLRLFGRLKN